jgi:hypothetical protein
MKPLCKKQAFTYVEVLIATTISLMVIAGIMVSFYAGLRIWKYHYVKAKSINDAYIGLGKMLNDIRGAYYYQLGTFNGGSFTALATNATQISSAIQILRTPKANDWFLYYYNPSSNAIFRAEYPGTVSNTLIVQNIAASNIFQTEIYTNTSTVVATSSTSNQTGLVSINLKFGLLNGTNSLLYGLSGTNIFQTRVSVCTRKI